MSGNSLQPRPEDDQRGRRFVVTLWQNATGTFFVRSCELAFRHFRNRTSFGTLATLDHVFTPHFAQAVQKCLGKLSLGTEVLSLPSFLLETPGLTVRGVHLMATRLTDGTLNIILRFGSFMGGINHVFAAHIGFDDPIGAQNEAISAQVLEDIASPLLDMCNWVEVGGEDAANMLGPFGKVVAERGNEIRFRIELLKRFIAGRPEGGIDPQLGFGPSAAQIR